METHVMNRSQSNHLSLIKLCYLRLSLRSSPGTFVQIPRQLALYRVPRKLNSSFEAKVLNWNGTFIVD